MRTNKGFTFVELMLTVAVLAGGFVFIYRGLLLSMDYQQHLIYRLYASQLLDEQMDEFKRNFAGQDIRLSGYQRNLNREINNKPVVFQLRLHPQPVQSLDGLAYLEGQLQWQERGRSRALKKFEFISRF